MRTEIETTDYIFSKVFIFVIIIVYYKLVKVNAYFCIFFAYQAM